MRSLMHRPVPFRLQQSYYVVCKLILRSVQALPLFLDIIVLQRMHRPSWFDPEVLF